MSVFCGGPLGTGVVFLLPSELGEFCVGKCQTQPEEMLLYGPRSSCSQHKAEELSCAIWTNSGCKLTLCEPRRRIKNSPHTGAMLSFSILCHMYKLLQLSQPWRSLAREGLNHSGKEGSSPVVAHPLNIVGEKHFFWGGRDVDGVMFHCQPSLCHDCVFSKVKESTKVEGMCSGKFQPFTKFFRNVVVVRFLKWFPAFGHFPSDCRSHVGLCQWADWYIAFWGIRM